MDLGDLPDEWEAFETLDLDVGDGVEQGRAFAGDVDCLAGAVTGLVTGPVTEPVIEPVTRPVAGPVTEPV